MGMFKRLSCFSERGLLCNHVADLILSGTSLAFSKEKKSKSKHYKFPFL